MTRTAAIKKLSRSQLLSAEKSAMTVVTGATAAAAGVSLKMNAVSSPPCQIWFEPRREGCSLETPPVLEGDGFKVASLQRGFEGALFNSSSKCSLTRTFSLSFCEYDTFPSVKKIEKKCQFIVNYKAENSPQRAAEFSLL